MRLFTADCISISGSAPGPAGDFLCPPYLQTLAMPLFMSPVTTGMGDRLRAGRPPRYAIQLR